MTILHNVTDKKWVRPLALEVDYTRCAAKTPQGIQRCRQERAE